LSESLVSAGFFYSLPLPCKVFLRRQETLHKHWEICVESGTCHAAAPRAEHGTGISLQPLHSLQFCSGSQLCQSFSWPSFHLTAYQLSRIFVLVWTQGTAVAALPPSMWPARRPGGTLGFLRLHPGLSVHIQAGNMRRIMQLHSCFSNFGDIFLSEPPLFMQEFSLHER